MSGDTRPVAARVRPPTWKDPRLVVGLVLIAVAVVAVVSVLRDADRTVPVYAAHGTLVPGTVLDESTVAVVHVRVGEGYLESPADAPFGRVLTRTVGDGELIPASALTDPDGFDGRPVAVVTTAPVAEAVRPGMLVDVWVTPEDAPSERMGEALVVSAIDREEGGFSLGGETVYVVVPAQDVGTMLDALASAAEVAVVGIG